MAAVTIRRPQRGGSSTRGAVDAHEPCLGARLRGRVRQSCQRPSIPAVRRIALVTSSGLDTLSA